MRNQIRNTKTYENQAALFYLGQEGILIKAHEKYLLIDGYLSDYVDRNCCTDTVLWKRRYNPPILPEELDFVDFVLCSHEHFDHTDPDTLKKIHDNNSKAVFIVPKPAEKTLIRYGIDPARILPAFAGIHIQTDDIDILPIPSAHEQLNRDENGNFRELGYKITLAGISIYHSGDCCVYDGLAEAIGEVNIAILPVNGRSYFKYKNDIIGNMDVYEAVELAKRINADIMIPVHFDLYDVNGLPASSVASAFDYAGRTLGYHIFYPGEKYIYAK